MSTEREERLERIEAHAKANANVAQWGRKNLEAINNLDS